MTINIHIKQTGFALGLALGVLIGLWLVSLWMKPPPPEPPCADEKPAPKGGDIRVLDPYREVG